MKKQITVKERNEWEGETFNYVLLVTPEEEQQIRIKCEELGDGSLSVKESNLSDEDIRRMDDASNNSYMDFIAPYRLNEGALDEWKEFGDCFYKGVGLTRLDSIQ